MHCANYRAQKWQPEGVGTWTNKDISVKMAVSRRVCIGVSEAPIPTELFAGTIFIDVLCEHIFGEPRRGHKCLELSTASLLVRTCAFRQWVETRIRIPGT